MKNIKIVLDAAHGEEVPGKRSPDGKFREYKWSRERIAEITAKLKSLGYEVFQSNPTTKEIGLSNRAAAANKIDGKKIFLSFHVDAAGMGDKWMNARGFTVYTTKGQNNSDKIAEIIMKDLITEFSKLQPRTDKSDGDLDKEADFTVIYKTNCPSVLIEWCFQDNREDVEILTNKSYNDRFVKTIVNAIEKINKLL